MGLDLLRRQPSMPEGARWELGLLASLAPALVMTEGWASPAVEEVYQRACELSEQLGESPERERVLFGLAAMHEMRAEYEKSQELIEQRIETAPTRPGSPLLVESYDLLACVLFHRGIFDQALDRADEGLTLYDSEQQHPMVAAFGSDPGVQNHGWAAFSLWSLGYPDQALERARRGLDLAQAHTYSLALAHAQMAWIHQFRRERDETQRHAEAALALAAEGGFPYFHAKSMVFGGWALAAAGEQAAGIERLRQGLEMCRRSGAMIDYPYYLALLAEAYGAAGDPSAGLERLDEALGCVQESRSFFYEAELHRIAAALLLQEGDEHAAEARYLLARDIAQRQQARSLELRACLGLALLLTPRGQNARARELLEPVFASFTEGFETPDHLAARAILAARP
jgi:adenylate cyclase